MRYSIFILCLLVSCFGIAQEKGRSEYTSDVSYFYGTIINHNKDISHLIREHPQGLVVGFQKKTFGNKRWEQEYNYPDWGGSFLYHKSFNETLGDNYGIYAHYNFYFFKRNLQFRVAQGIAYTTNPFDLQDNFKNNAYGSRILSTTYFLLQYKKENIYKNLGFQAGLLLSHYSNGNIKAPNSSTNTIAASLGLVYSINNDTINVYKKEKVPKVKESVKLNVVFRAGVNESDYLNLGQHPFFVGSVFADKRVSYKSTLQLGADVFFSKTLEKEIEYLSVAFPNGSVSGEEDSKRIGLFVGHELRISKVAIVSHFGYYVYYPYDFEGRTYIRVGIKYYITPKVFAVTTLKAHGAKAEGIEFGVGMRLF